jgi:hypothetical protein
LEGKPIGLDQKKKKKELKGELMFNKLKEETIPYLQLMFNTN